MMATLPDEGYGAPAEKKHATVPGTRAATSMSTDPPHEQYSRIKIMDLVKEEEKSNRISQDFKINPTNSQ
jgi:hypothetical protein